MAPSTQRPFSFQIDRHLFRLAPETVFRGDPHTTDPVAFLAPQYSTSEAQISYADVNRSVEIPVAQNNFSGGLARRIEFAQDTATQFRYSKNWDTSGPSGTIFPAPKVTTIGAVITKQPLQAVQKGNITYVACETDLYQVTDLSTRTLDTTFADPITDLIVWNDKIIVGFGEGAATNIQYRVSDTIAAAFTSAARKGEFFALVQNNPIGPVLYTSLAKSIVGSQDILSTSPTATFPIGNTYDSITSLTAHGDHLLVGKEAGPWEFDTNYVARPIVDKALELENYITMARTAISWRGLYIFTGKHSVYSWNGQGVTSVGFDLLADPQIPGGQYRPDSFSADPHFLYAGWAQATSAAPQNGVYIWKTPDGGKTWHNYLWRSDLGIASKLLFATNKIGSVSQNAVLFAYKSGTNWQLAWAPWSSVLDPTKDTGYTFDNVTNAVLRTCDYTGNLATVSKHTNRIKLVADHLTETGFVDAYAYLDDQSALKIATFKRSPYEELALFQAKDYLRVSLEMRATGSSTAAATVQQIHGFEMPLRFLTRQVQIHRVHLVAMDDQPLGTGGQASPRGSYFKAGFWKTIIEDLTALRRTQAAVDCTDEDGIQFQAYIQDFATRTVQPRDGGSPIKMMVLGLLEVAQV